MYFKIFHLAAEKANWMLQVWNCDDCRVARGMQPHGNIKKANSQVPDVVKKTAAK